MCAIIKCKCKNQQQDELHGIGNRVANPTSKTDAARRTVYRCTVCLSTTSEVVK